MYVEFVYQTDSLQRIDAYCMVCYIECVHECIQDVCNTAPILSHT
jgi:hypothetical protein